VLIAGGWAILWAVVGEGGLDIRTFATTRDGALEKWREVLGSIGPTVGYCVVRVKVEVIDSVIKQLVDRGSLSLADVL
jgi:hypothetical protein